MDHIQNWNFKITSFLMPFPPQVYLANTLMFLSTSGHLVKAKAFNTAAFLPVEAL